MQFFTTNMVLLGDFNSITVDSNHLSGILDPTSAFLRSLLQLWNLREPQGSHLFSFSYHHPSLADRKSRLDWIYSNIDWQHQCCFSHHISCSDHYMIGTYCLPSCTSGPKLWRFSEDLLTNQSFVEAIQQHIMGFQYENVVESWENFKTCVQTFPQKKIKFRLKHRQRTLCSLWTMLRYINKRIFNGEKLEFDQLRIQNRIEQVHNKIAFFDRGEGDDLIWVLQEGHMIPNFLHLEDIKRDLSLKRINTPEGLLMDPDVILVSLHDFYQHLYQKSDTKSDLDILAFLSNLHLPKVESTKSLVGPITYKEVEAVIKKLCPGKSPGSDGLTASFYKHFAELLSPVLEVVFNKIFDEKSLTFSQHLAIIILLFKKGDDSLLPNYRPISLMNTDYKIVAYILTVRLLPCLESLIHPHQTAYMPGCFIGTNIHFVQDTIDKIASENGNELVLFLDFKKVFDSVSHNFLCQLLSHIGIPHDLWIKILYQKAMSCV